MGSAEECVTVIIIRDLPDEILFSSRTQHDASDKHHNKTPVFRQKTAFRVSCAPWWMLIKHSEFKISEKMLIRSWRTFFITTTLFRVSNRFVLCSLTLSFEILFKVNTKVEWVPPKNTTRKKKQQEGRMNKKRRNAENVKVSLTYIFRCRMSFSGITFTFIQHRLRSLAQNLQRPVSIK